MCIGDIPLSGTVLPFAFNTAFACILIATAFFTVIVNVLLLTSFIATKQAMKNTSNFLITCLSLVDLLNGAMALPLMSLLFLANGKMENCFVLTASLMSPAILTNISGYITVLIAIDRYIHMNPDFHNRPSKLAKLFEKPRLYILLVVSSTLAGAVSASSFFVYKMGTFGTTIANILLVVLAMFFLSFMVTIYASGYLRIRQFTVDNPVHATQSTTDGPMYLRELYKTILIVLVTLVVAYTPYLLLIFITTVLLVVDPNKLTLGLLQLRTATLLLMFSTCITNTLVIFYRNKKTKGWLLGKIQCHRNRAVLGIENRATIHVAVQVNGRIIRNRETAKQPL